MAESDRLKILAAWLAEAIGPINSQVHVRERKQGSGRQTVVTIDHRLACSLNLHEGWRITTKTTYLPPKQFTSLARHYLKTAEAARGRTLYCHDLTAAEVVAALSYHLDKDTRMPVLIPSMGKASLQTTPLES